MHALYIILAIISILTGYCEQKSLNCRSNNAGLYYLNLNDTSSNYQWYFLMHLNSDGSTIFVGSDQHSLQTATTSEAIAQPYSGLLGKWTCKKKSGTIKMKITSYNFEYPTSSLPEGNYINVAKFELNLNQKTKQVAGEVTGRFLKLTTKALGGKVEEMEQDQVEGPVTVNVNGYLVQRYRE